ncbi:High-affinity branched-chain amino acid transport ATP-binding protein LivF [Ensifer psoraleae]|uniref:ABC transporter ATP-binding protein n=1 Tax=Sinorhizobium psoraleae TaxID=520838 RepID=UPI001AEF138F|nr:ABC transporter ATP-binding protein [Sinorhizobium psoraleae]NRP75625.1 High-affinity branched-chain amino acid transport ATP-binding protein LivF [Sinorhizobium psoraleae]
MAEIMLQVSNMWVHYGQVPAVRNLSLEVHRNEIVCVVGPNGAGKSTMLLAVAGALTPTKGEVRLNGVSVVGKAPEYIAKLGISLIPEGRHIFKGLTVEENLKVGAAANADRSSVENNLRTAYSVFPVLAERRHGAAGMLSGGEQQQLAIARALMSGARLIMIDEPSLGLAPKITEKVFEVLSELRRSSGLTLLIIEQNLKRALKYSDRIYILRNSEIVFSGRSAELQASDDLHSAYFGLGQAPSNVGAGQ